MADSSFEREIEDAAGGWKSRKAQPTRQGWTDTQRAVGMLKANILSAAQRKAHKERQRQAYGHRSE